MAPWRTYFSFPAFRVVQGFSPGWSRTVYLMISAALLGLTAMFHSDFKIDYHRALIYGSTYLVFSLFRLAVSGARFPTLGNALFAAMAPFCITPYQPALWIAYIASATNDGLHVRASVLHALALAALPLGMWAIDARLNETPLGELGPVLIASLMGVSAYLWITLVLGQRETESSRIRLLRSQEIRREAIEPINRDLHEALGSSLTRLTLICQTASDALRKDKEVARQMLLEAETISRRTLQRLRFSLRALSQDEMAWANFLSGMRGALREYDPRVIMHSEIDQQVAGKPLTHDFGYHLLLMVMELLDLALPLSAGPMILLIKTESDAWSLELSAESALFPPSPIALLPVPLRKHMDRIDARLEFNMHEPGSLRMRILGSTAASFR